MSNGEYGDNFAEQESRKMERQQAFNVDLEKLRTLNYSDSEFLGKRKALSELNETL